MSEAATKARTPRPAWVTSAIITVASLILAFIVGSIVMVVSDVEVAQTWTYFFSRPGDALAASWDKISATFYAMWVGSMGSWVAITNTTAEAAPLICAGLGVAVAFRAGLFNIGAQGQAMLGALKASRRTMVTMAGTPDKLTDLIQALVVLFVAAPAFVAWLLPFLKERKVLRENVPVAKVAEA